MFHTPTLYQQALAMIRETRESGTPELAFDALKKMEFIEGKQSPSGLTKTFTGREGYNVVFVEYQPEQRLFCVKHLAENETLAFEEVSFD